MERKTTITSTCSLYYQIGKNYIVSFLYIPRKIVKTELSYCALLVDKNYLDIVQYIKNKNQ